MMSASRIFNSKVIFYSLFVLLLFSLSTLSVLAVSTQEGEEVPEVSDPEPTEEEDEVTQEPAEAEGEAETEDPEVPETSEQEDAAPTEEVPEPTVEEEAEEKAQEHAAQEEESDEEVEETTEEEITTVPETTEHIAEKDVDEEVEEPATQEEDEDTQQPTEEDAEALEVPEPTATEVVVKVETPKVAYQTTTPDFGYASAESIAVNHSLGIGSGQVTESLSGARFGSAIADLGDLDGAGAGVKTLAIGSPGSNVRGKLILLNLNAAGGIVSEVVIDHDSSDVIANNNSANRFGSAVANLGDLDIGLSGTNATSSKVTIAVGESGGFYSSNFNGAVFLINLNESLGIVGDVVSVNTTDTNLDIIALSDFGRSVANLGDLDGSAAGETTIAVGAPKHTKPSGVSEGGAIYIININTDGTVRGTPSIIESGSLGFTPTAEYRFGQSVANLGDLDINLSSSTDKTNSVVTVAVGSIGDDTGGNDKGAIHLINLNASGGVVGTPVRINSGTTNLTLPGTQQNHFGASVVSLGDLDGTGAGVATLAVGAPSFNLGSAVDRPDVFILNINSSGAIIGTAGIINNSNLSATIAANSELGQGIASIGDLDGDGIDEIAIGNTYDSSQTFHIISFTQRKLHFSNLEEVDITLPAVETGESPTYTLSPALPTGLEFTAATRKITGSPEATSAATDYTLTATIGSDTDTYDFSIETSITLVDPEFRYGSAGLIAVNHFSAINSNSDGLTLADDDDFGSSVVDLGDIDGTGGGVTTIAVGSPGDDDGGTNRGAVHLIKLNTEGAIEGSVATIAHGTRSISLANGSLFGTSVANLGDIGDGDITLAIGAPGSDRIFLFFINSDLTLARDPVEIDSTVVTNITSGDKFGSAIANLGDLDGTGAGVTSIAVTAIDGDGAVGTDRGEIYIIHLNATGGKEGEIAEVNSSTGLTLVDNDKLGRSVVNLGDLDIGLSDATQETNSLVTIAVGVTGDDVVGGTDRGAVHLINLNSAGEVVGTPIKLNSDTTGITLIDGEGLGWAIENLGDVDGDGVGVTTLAVSTQEQERVHIININSVGEVVGTAGVIDATSLGITIQNNDRFGSAMTNIGDINGDGVDEFIIGEREEDTGGDNRGELNIVSYIQREYSFSISDSVDITLPAIEIGSPTPTYSLPLTPALPTGLLFDEATRRITGSPTALSAATDYTLTATISSSTDTFDFNIEVVAAVAPEATGAPDFGYADAGIIAVNHFAKISDSNAELTLPNDHFFGRSIANLGDLDGTGAGVTTIAVGTPNDNTGGQARGAIYLVNIDAAGGIEGTPVKIDDDHAEIPLENRDGFGIAIVDLGDLDIGLDDPDTTSSLTTIAVGTSKDDDGGDTGLSENGAVYIINLNSSGIVGSVVKISDNTTGIDLSNGSEFGKSIANLGDLDIGLTTAQATNSIVTLAFGVFDGTTVGGEVHIINLDIDGALVGDHQKISAVLLEINPSNQDFFGNSIANIGDLDIGLSSSTDKTNSLVTIAVGAPAAELAFGVGPEGITPYPNNGGSIYLINLDESGSKVGDVIKIGKDTPGLNVNHGEGFGGSIKSLGDIDGTGDGIATLAIGNGGIDAVKIINLSPTGAIVGPVGIIGDSNISDTLSIFDKFGGNSIENIGDINGDGIDEIAVGEVSADSQKGEVHIISIASKEYGLTTSDSVSITLPAAETGSPTYTFAPSLPAGLTFDDVARTITGTPTQNTRGKDYTLTAKNSLGTDTFSFRLGVGGLIPTHSSDNDLSGLAISSYTSGGQPVPGVNIWNSPTTTQLTLQPTFSSSVTEYTISETLAVGTQAAIIFPTTSSPRATVTVDGEDATSGIGSAQVILTGGDNVIPVTVTAEDGTEQEYTITVVKTRPPLEISTISTDGYVNDAEDESDIIISGFTSGIADAETIDVTFSDANITAKTATVTNNAWQTKIPSAEMKAAAEGDITVTATHASSSETATKTFTYDRTPPTVATSTPDQTATVGTQFSITITEHAFADTASTIAVDSKGQSNGIVFLGLSWVGAGELLKVGTVRITAIGIDLAGNTVTDTFDIVITDPRYDSTAPTITKAEATRKTSITLTSPEALTGTATASDFSVSYGSVTNATPDRVTINDDAITIIVDDPMTTEDTITVSYSGITITDIIGNSLKAFSNQAVENNITSGGGSGGVQAVRKNISSTNADSFFQNISQPLEKEELIQDVKRKIEEIQRRIEEIMAERELPTKVVSPSTPSVNRENLRQQVLDQIEEVQKRIDEILAEREPSKQVVPTSPADAKKDGENLYDLAPSIDSLFNIGN